MRSSKPVINHDVQRRKGQRGPSSHPHVTANTPEESTFAPNTPTQHKEPSRQPFAYQDATPCGRCQMITVEKLIQGCHHHTSFRSLMINVAGGCKLCKLFYDGLEFSCRPSVSFNVLDTVDDNKVVLMQHRGVSNVLGPIHSIVVQLEPTKFIKWEIGLYVTKGSLYSNLILNNPIPMCPDAEALCETVRGWLAASGAQPVSELPQRVIDVLKVSDDWVRLQEMPSKPKKQRAHYICLSHRWNEKKSPLRTTSETLEDRKRRIWVRDLSQTFQDAITITRKLGIRYLWIDSLCILQDCHHDWERESSMMGEYYRSSYLTIGAGMGQDGLFIKRKTTPYEYCRLDMTSGEFQPAVDASVYFLIEPLGLNPSTWTPEPSSLDSRGWTMQEKMLSPLFLSFEPSQVHLRTTTMIFSECGQLHNLRVDDKLKLLLDDELTGWKSLVRKYSGRDLTQSSDRLPAISGLAYEYQQRWNVRYLAGLWEKDLWHQLLWSSEKPARPKQWTAPSWSWASVDSAVEFKNPRLCCVEVVRCEIDNAGNNPFGQIQKGVLTLKGVLLDRVRVQTLDLETQRLRAHETHVIYIDEERCDFVPDELLDPDLEELWFLYISANMGIVL